MSETKHTPEQWSIDSHHGTSHIPGLTPCGRDWSVIINDAEGCPIAYATGYDKEEAEQAAGKIVRAVNAHEAMLGALKQLADVHFTEDNCASFDVANRRIRNIACSAIALAEKGEVL